MSDDDALDDEIVSINAICGDDTLRLLDAKTRLCALMLPSGSAVIVRVQFPHDYPDNLPVILGTESVGDDASKGAGAHAVDLARRVLDEIFMPGEPCIYALIEELREQFLGSQAEAAADRIGKDEESELQHQPSSQFELDVAPLWSIAPSICEKKSVFSGRVARVESPEQAKAFLQHFLSTDKKAAKATHNIVAWRIQGNDSTSYQDCDDDGETAAGGRLLHLLQLMDIWNVMVVVTRWYGGTHLGPDRFRIINNAARNALDLAGLVQEGSKRAK